MVVLKLLSAFTLTALLSGCDVVDDVKKIKSDVRALKAYVMATTAPNECQAPGTKQARLCSYTLVVKKVDKDLFIGHVPKKVVEDGQKACERTLKEISKGDPDKKDYNCTDPAYYRYAWYGFKIEGATPKEGVAQDFFNVPHTEYLKLGTVEKIDEGGSMAMNSGHQ